MTNGKLRISALSYSNTFPFVYGLQQKLKTEVGEIDYEVPAKSAERFRDNEVDVALVPVGALAAIGDHQIITNYCIGADGPVKTVCLYSNVPLNEIKCIYLDNESRTSVRLVRVLSENYWKIYPEFIQYSSDINIKEKDAIVLIGDKTFGKSTDYKFTFDLAGEWKSFTGLPFVFAVWVSKNNLSTDLICQLNDILKFGIENISELKHHFKLPVSEVEYMNYIESHIDFNLNDTKIKAMNLFLDFVKKMDL